MSSRPIVELGSFVVGEVPLPLDYQFLDADGVPINLTGFVNVSFQWGHYVRGLFVNPVTELAIITDAVNGVATYEWDGDEFADTGAHAGMFWVNDGSTQYGSILITWQVCQSVGTPPIV
jgi:hypothetical protein